MGFVRSTPSLRAKNRGEIVVSRGSVAGGNAERNVAATDPYAKPYCSEGEKIIPFLRGSVCAPPCEEGAQCPDNLHPGMVGSPVCLLFDKMTRKDYCVLVCAADYNCPQGALCESDTFGTGICIFPGTTL